MIAQLCERLNTNELYILNDLTVWYVNYIPINMFLKKEVNEPFSGW